MWCSSRSSRAACFCVTSCFHVEHRALGLVSRIVANVGRGTSWCQQINADKMMWKDREGTSRPLLILIY